LTCEKVPPGITLNIETVEILKTPPFVGVMKRLSAEDILAENLENIIVKVDNMICGAVR